MDADSRPLARAHQAGRPDHGLLTIALLLLIVFCGVAPAASSGPTAATCRLETAFEADAYYTNASLTLALTRAPVPHLGELPEGEFYRFLGSQAIVPRFVLLEASINPLPDVGVLVRQHQSALYGEAQLTPRLNVIEALTAGFEEPWALSLFAGSIVDFGLAGHPEIGGRGYSGYLVSTGDHHIQDNRLVDDQWWEFEWKLKGDRRSPVKKLNWSFRVGAKVHGNHEVADIVYFSFRRSRVDYRPERPSLLNNVGGEYTMAVAGRRWEPVRHHLLVDRHWPLRQGHLILSLAAGLLWDSSREYSGALAAGRSSTTAFVLRPNITF